MRFGFQIGLLWIDWGDTFLVIWINLLIGALFWLIQAHPLFILLVMSCEVQMVWIGWLRMYHLGNLSRLKKKIKVILCWFQWNPSHRYDYFTSYYDASGSISGFGTKNFLFYTLNLTMWHSGLRPIFILFPLNTKPYLKSPPSTIISRWLKKWSVIKQFSARWPRDL